MEAALRRYMAGDVIRLELALVHRANLARVFVAFSHVEDHLTELYFETVSSFLTEIEAGEDSKRTVVDLEAPVPPEAVPGVYELTRVNIFSVGGKLVRLREGELADASEARFEVVEEPAEVPAVAGLEFLG